MAAVNSLFSLRFRALVLVLIVAVAGCSQKASSQAAAGCPTQLSSLNLCAPFVVPGASDSNPSADCCSALQAIDHDCICNTLRIASRLPSHCNVPPLNCDANA